MKRQNSRAVPNKPKASLSESSIHIHQIDAEITRLTKQIEYLKRVRRQYAHLIEGERHVEG